MPAYHVFEMSNLVGLLLNLFLLGVISWNLIMIEKRVNQGQKFIILSICAIFGIAGRILLSPIPNVQPVTVIVLLVGIRMGAKESIFLSSTIALFSNLILGHGIWTFYQAAAWSLIGCLGALFSDKLNTLNRLIFISILSAFLFNWIVSISILHSVGFELFLPYLVAGIPYDLLHVVGNITFMIWLSSPLSEIMSRNKNNIMLLGEVE
ncbi:MAG: DUF6580 family putative transport protein, partial [Candidatus Thermoplasmatota archaeon]|nr:DUF6580 family putative transport protein [Candidatus Thermoplasmatota archaeon]